MNLAAEKVCVDALSLPVDDRVELVRVLIDSLEATPDHNVGEAFDAELNRRLDEMRTGRVALISESDALVELRAHLATIRQ